MDEILIEEKKYVSSKQAAKITGYAKDYIGQLCREGRVPARLVGRSWYVLESAIQDHRFGNQEEDAKTAPQAVPPASALPQTWEFPRYEASQPEILPSVNRLHAEKEFPMIEDDRKVSSENPMDSLHDSWRAWFEHVADAVSATKTETPSEPEAVVEPEMPQKEEEPEIQVSEEAVEVPLHVVASRPRLPDRELLPREAVQAAKAPISQRTRKGSATAAMWRSIQVAGILIAVISATVAVIGSGYFDEYLVSVSQANTISGTLLYNK